MQSYRAEQVRQGVRPGCQDHAGAVESQRLVQPGRDPRAGAISFRQGESTPKPPGWLAGKLPACSLFVSVDSEADFVAEATPLKERSGLLQEFVRTLEVGCHVVKPSSKPIGPLLHRMLEECGAEARQPPQLPNGVLVTILRHAFGSKSWRMNVLNRELR
jgi:hypothetical protein